MYRKQVDSQGRGHGRKEGCDFMDSYSISKLVSYRYHLYHHIPVSGKLRVVLSITLTPPETPESGGVDL